MKKLLIFCLACWSSASLVMAQTSHDNGSSIQKTEVATMGFTNGSAYTAPAGTPNTLNNPIGRFTLAAPFGTMTLNSVMVTFAGTNANITSVKLWVSTDGTFNNVTQLGTTQAFGSTATFASLSSSVTTSAKNYFVSLDLGSSTGDVSATINQSTDFTGSNPVSGTFPAALSSSAVPLPVEIVNFIASSDNSSTILTWNTPAEVNNYGFTVERRGVADGQVLVNNDRWKEIGFVQGNGTSSSPHEYSFNDQKLAAGKYAYRLKQVDNSGAFKYYAEAQIEIAAPAVFALGANFPNPFNPSTTIRYALPTQSRARLIVYNALGQIVAELVNTEQAAGWNDVVWSPKVASGLYFYRLEAVSVSDPNKRFVDVKRMVLLK